MTKETENNKKMEEFVIGIRDLISEAKHLAPHVILTNFENAIITLTVDSYEETKKEMKKEAKKKKKEKAKNEPG